MNKRTYVPAAAPNLIRARPNGFTLIEVLIAMTLLSIMVVLLFSSLRICAQSWELGENKINEVNKAAVVYNFFQRHLASALPLWNDFNNDGNAGRQSKQSLSFQGSNHSLQFVSTFPASAGRSGLQLFSIEPDEQDGEQILKVTLTPFFPTTDDGAWRQDEAVLLKHVENFSLAYFGINGNGDSGSWQEQWLDQKTQPRLVKITIDTSDGAYWPEMIIELKVEEPVVNKAPAVKPATTTPNPFLAPR